MRVGAGGGPGALGEHAYSRGVRVEILRIEECPNWQQAESAVQTAAQRLGLNGLEVVVRVLTTDEDAAAVPFAGSPTVLVEGRDPFPSGGPTGLACRVYPTPAGFRGAPSVEQLMDVLRKQQ